MKSSPSFLRPSGADAAAPAVQEGRVTTLLDGANHVAILTNDTARLHAFYREVFDATVSQDATHGDGTRLSFVDIGASTELNVFEVTGNLEAQRQTRCSGAAASIIWASRRRRGRHSTSSGHD